MIDRLQDALSYLEHLPPEAQEEVATHIEALAEALIRHRSTIRTQSQYASNQEIAGLQWQNLFGVWSDLPDTMLDDLDQLRHSSQPTSLLEL